MIWGWSTEGVAEKQAKELNLNLEDRRLRLRLRLTLELAKQLIGTPRHLSQHPGGFVLTLDRLDELVPVETGRPPWTTGRSSNGTRTISTRSNS